MISTFSQNQVSDSARNNAFQAVSDSRGIVDGDKAGDLDSLCILFTYAIPLGCELWLQISTVMSTPNPYISDTLNHNGGEAHGSLAGDPTSLARDPPAAPFSAAA